MGYLENKFKTGSKTDIAFPSCSEIYTLELLGSKRIALGSFSLPSKGSYSVIFPEMGSRRPTFPIDSINQILPLLSAATAVGREFGVGISKIVKLLKDGESLTILFDCPLTVS